MVSRSSLSRHRIWAREMELRRAAALIAPLDDPQSGKPMGGFADGLDDEQREQEMQDDVEDEGEDEGEEEQEEEEEADKIRKPGDGHSQTMTHGS
jgi:hypothetical protein